MEFIKNFLALTISTVTWSAGLVGIASTLIVVFTFDLFFLIPTAASLVIVGLGMLAGKYNERIKAALEFPFGFLLG